MDLKTTQLTLAKIAQMGRHEILNARSEHHPPRVEGSIPVGGNFLLNLFYSSTILAEVAE